jgi:hypothetical protein
MEDSMINNNLDFDKVFEQSIRKGKKDAYGGFMLRGLKKVSLSAIIIVLVATTVLNVSPSFANNATKWPLIGGILKILVFTEYKIDDDTYNAEITVPKIEGLEDSDLQNTINEKYMEEAKLLYNNFVKDMEDVEKNGGGHLGINSGFVIKTDNERILSIGRYIVNTAASSSTTFKYDTIDKKNEILITLASLFNDDTYMKRISEVVIKQMEENYAKDSSMFYWISSIEKEMIDALFTQIKPDQSFYINNDGKLVISFDKYEVAPGYMGVQEFVIPTEEINDLLVSKEYIK